MKKQTFFRWLFNKGCGYIEDMYRRIPTGSILRELVYDWEVADNKSKTSGCVCLFFFVTLYSIILLGCCAIPLYLTFGIPMSHIFILSSGFYLLLCFWIMRLFIQWLYKQYEKDEDNYENPEH